MAAAGVGEGSSVSTSYTGDPAQWNTVQDDMVTTNDSTTQSIEDDWDDTAQVVTDDIDDITTAAEGLDSTHVIDVSLADSTPDGDVKTDIEAINTAKTNLQADPDIALTATLEDASGDGTVADTLTSIDAKMKDLADKKAALEVSLAQGDPDGTVQKAIDNIDSKMDDLKKKKAALEVSLNDTSKDGDVQTEIDDIDKKMTDLAKKKAALEVSLTESGDMDTYDSINAALDDIVAKMKDLADKKAALTVTLTNTTDEGDSVSHSLDADAKALGDLQTDAKDPVDITVTASDNGTIAKEETAIQDLRDDAAVPVIVDVQGKGTGLTTDDTETTTLNVVDDPDAERVITEFKDELASVPDEETTALDADATQGDEDITTFTGKVKDVDAVTGTAKLDADPAAGEAEITSFDETVGAVDAEHVDAHLGATYDPATVAAVIEALKLQIKEGTAGDDFNVSLNWTGIAGGSKPSKSQDKDLQQGLASGFASFLSNAGLTDLDSMVESALKADKIVVFAAGGALVTGLAGMIASAMPGLGGAVFSLVGANNVMKTKLTAAFGRITTLFSQDVSSAMAGPGPDALTYTKKTAPTKADIGKVIPLGGALGALLTSVGVMENDLVQPTKDFGAGMTIWCAALDKIISSKGFKDLLNQVSTFSENSSAQWGTIVGEFLQGIGQMLVAMEPLETTVLGIFSSMAASFSGNKAKGAEDKFFNELNNFLTKDAPDLKSMFDSIGTLATTLITVITAAGPGIADITTAGAAGLNTILTGLGSLLNVLNSLGSGGKVASGAVVIGLLATYKKVFTTALPALFKAIFGVTLAPKKGKPTPGGIPDDSTNPNISNSTVTTAAEQIQSGGESVQKGGADILTASENMTNSADVEDTAGETQVAASETEEAASIQEEEAALVNEAGGGSSKIAGLLKTALTGVIGAGGLSAGALAGVAGIAGLTGLIAGGAYLSEAVFPDTYPNANQPLTSPSSGPKSKDYQATETNTFNTAMQDIAAGVKLPKGLMDDTLNGYFTNAQDMILTGFEKAPAGTQTLAAGFWFVKLGPSLKAMGNVNGTLYTDGMAAGMADAKKQAAMYTALKTQADNLVKNHKIYLGEKSPSKLSTAIGVDYLLGFNKGIGDAPTQKTVTGTLTTFLDKLITTGDTYTPKFTTLGSDWSTALGKGITADQSLVVTAATNLANAAVAAVQAVFAKANSTTNITNSVNIPITTGTGVIPNNVVTQIQGVVYETLNNVAQASASTLRQT